MTDAFSSPCVPASPGLENVLANFDKDMMPSGTAFSELCPKTDDAGTHGEENASVMNLRKVIFTEADRMMEEKAAEMWRAMREMMLEVQKTKDAEVAAISEELLRCKEENRRMKEDGANMKLEIERLSAVGNLLDRDVQPSLFRDAGNFTSHFTSAPPFLPAPSCWPSPHGPLQCFSPAVFQASTAAPSSPSTAGTSLDVSCGPSPGPSACASPPPARHREGPQAAASPGPQTAPSPGPLRGASPGGAVLREATPVRQNRTSNPAMPRTPTGRHTPKRPSMFGTPTPMKSPVPHPSPFVICETGGCFFSFTLRKADGVDLGIHMIRTDDDKAWRVDGVGAGTAVDAWNRQCAGGSGADKAVLAGDKIVSVNGRTDCDGMLEECRAKALLKFVVVRGDPDCEVSGSWMEVFKRDPRATLAVPHRLSG